MSRPADSILTHLLEAPGQSLGSARSAPLLISRAGALSNLLHYLLKIKKVELGSSGKSWKTSIKPVSSGNSNNSWGGPREELPGKEQCVKFSLGSLNSPWPSGLLAPTISHKEQPWLSNMLIIRAYQARREGKVSAKRKVLSGPFVQEES